ncbi:MAG TPA: hypothetical protein VIF40_02255 [Methylosinus sp.]|jgi:type VI protein secretion system component VasK|uniref:hypothetical protein n=1 Tax=Methylosinus sp. TaxID=427 RepID=UPI002F95D3DE
MRFHVGRSFHADGARDRKTAPRTATDIVFAARSAAQTDEPGSPRKAPMTRIVFVATALAAPLIGARIYVDATRTEPTAIAAQEAAQEALQESVQTAARESAPATQAAPAIRQAELPPAKAEHGEVDLTATGSTPTSRLEVARPTSPPAKGRRTTKGVSRSATEISRNRESYR